MGIGYSGHKHQKGEKILAISDNLGNVVAPLIVNSINVHDTRLFPDSLYNFLELAHYQELDVKNSFLTLDTGFDSQLNRNLILEFNLVPVIKPNPGRKSQTKRYEQLDEFSKYQDVYNQRFTIERCFAWEDKYRKLVIRYETLQSTFMGFRYLAFSMINFRWFFGNNLAGL